MSGYKVANSIETALVIITVKLHVARSTKLSSILILLDLSALFHTVNNKTLLFILDWHLTRLSAWSSSFLPQMTLNLSSPVLPQTLTFLLESQHVWQLISGNIILAKLSCCTSLEMHPHVL